MPGTSARSSPTSRRTSGCCGRSTFRPARRAGAPTCSRRARGQKIVVINVMCRLFMDALDDPFRALDAELAKYALGRTAPLHPGRRPWRGDQREAVDGSLSATAASRRCWARHSHVPTADGWVLPGGTAYQTDVGMCGDYDSVIGMKKEVASSDSSGKCRASACRRPRARELCARRLSKPTTRPASPGRSGRSGWGAAYRRPPEFPASCIPQGPFIAISGV